MQVHGAPYRLGLVGLPITRKEAIQRVITAARSNLRLVVRRGGPLNLALGLSFIGSRRIRQPVITGDPEVSRRWQCLASMRL